MQRSEVPGIMKIVRNTFIGPFNSPNNEPRVSRCRPNSDPQNSGHLEVKVTNIPPGTTVVVESGNISVTASGQQQICVDSVKLNQLDAYPLPEVFLCLYSKVKFCEIRFYMLDIDKVFHFLAELPALKKLGIGHEAICGEENGNSGQMDASMDYAGRRICQSLEQVCVKVDEAHFGTRSESSKRIIEKRVQKIVQLIVKTAPNIRIAEFDLPSEMDCLLSDLYARFPVGVNFNGSSRPRLRLRLHAQPSEEGQSQTTSAGRGPIKLKYRRYNGGPRPRIVSSSPQEIPVVNLEDDGCGDGDVSIVEEIHGSNANRESDASSTSTRTGGRGRSSRRRRRRSLGLLLGDRQ